MNKNNRTILFGFVLAFLTLNPIVLLFNNPISYVHPISASVTNYKTSEYVDDWGTSGNPTEWNLYEPSGTDIEIVDSFGEHSFPMKFTDASSDGAKADISFTAKTSGSISLWALNTLTTSDQFCCVNLYESSARTTTALRIIMMSGNFYALTTGGWSLLGQTYSANTWYHIKVDFDCSTDQNYDVFIDGIEKGTDIAFYSFVNDIDTYDAYTGWSTYDTGYIDAVILPDSGAQTFYENGAEHLEPIDYKTSQYVDDWGTSGNPTGWNLYEPSGTDIEIVDSFGGHSFPMKFTDASSDGTKADISFTAKTSGSISLWALNTLTTSDQFCCVNLYESSAKTTTALRIIMMSGNFYALTTGGWSSLGQTYSANTWYHIKVDFDCSTQTYDVFIDGAEKGTDIAFYSSVADIDTYDAYTGWSTYDTGYIDAVILPDSGAQTFYENGPLIDYKSSQYVDDWGTSGNPTGWTSLEPSGTDVDVVSSYERHTFPIKLSDGNPNDDTAQVVRTFSPTTTSSISLWTLNTLTTSDQFFCLNLYESSVRTTAALRIIMMSGYFYALTTGGWSYLGQTYSANTWYHIKVDFDCSPSTQTYDVFIDGVEKGTDIAFHSYVDDIDTYDAHTGWSSYDVGYIDAVILPDSDAQTFYENWPYFDDDDSDTDGVIDIVELNKYGTDPTDSDTDDDGLTDGEEVNTYGTDPLDIDTDNDDLNDGVEVNTYGTDPTDTDTDDDGLTDGAEINTYGTDPTDTDTDDDGLNDGVEVNTYESNPTDTDTDEDGLTDGIEVNTYGSDPIDPDSDDDGLTDGVEVNTYGTDPTNTDTDDDSLLDGVEIYATETDPTVANRRVCIIIHGAAGNADVWSTNGVITELSKPEYGYGVENIHAYSWGSD